MKLKTIIYLLTITLYLPACSGGYYSHLSRAKTKTVIKNSPSKVTIQHRVLVENKLLSDTITDVAPINIPTETAEQEPDKTEVTNNIGIEATLKQENNRVEKPNNTEETIDDKPNDYLYLFTLIAIGVGI